VVQGQSGGGLGDEVPQKLKGVKGVKWGCPLPTGESGSGLGGGCAPSQIFLKFLSENGKFWCILAGTLCDLLTHLLNFKRNRDNVEVNVRKDERMRLSFLPEQLVRSSQQLVLKDTKKGFY